MPKSLAEVGLFDVNFYIVRREQFLGDVEDFDFLVCQLETMLTCVLGKVEALAYLYSSDKTCAEYSR